MTKRIILLIIASIAAGVCSFAQEVKFTANPAVKKIKVLDIKSRNGGQAKKNLNDDNLKTEYFVVVPNGQQQGSVIFTLAKKHIGTFMLYCYEEARVKLADVGSGRVLGEYYVSTEYGQPFIAVVNKDLTHCQDGKYRIRVIFGANSPVENMAPHDDDFYCSFSIKEISFWKDNVINPVWPVGDRAVYGVRGPVKSLRLTRIDDEKSVILSAEFDSDGKRVFREGTTVLDCIIGKQRISPLGDIITEYKCVDDKRRTHHLVLLRRYDDKGRLITSARSCEEMYDGHECWDYHTCLGFTGKFTYTNKDLLSEEEESTESGEYSCQYVYENGQLKASHECTYAGRDFLVDTVYTILEVDKYGNWTKRKCESRIDDFDPRTESYVEVREIIYY